MNFAYFKQKKTVSMNFAYFKQKRPVFMNFAYFKHKSSENLFSIYISVFAPPKQFVVCFIYLLFSVNDCIDCLCLTVQIQWGACGLVLAGNVVVFLTILGYFYVFGNDDFDYSMW